MAGDDELVEIRVSLKDARRFVTDAKGVSRHVTDIGDSAERTSRRMKAASMAAEGFGMGLDVMRRAITYGAVALTTFGITAATFSVNAASNLTEQVNKATVVFRGSERGIIAWAGTLAESFGVSQRMALEAAGVFGNMLVPMGFARSKAAGMSKSLVQLAGDMASFNNADPSEVMEAMRAGLSGETEPLRKYGVFLSDAVIQQEAMRLGMKKVGGSLTAAQKAQASYNIMVRQTKDAHGDFARSSGTSLANQLRILKATTENLAAAMGAKLLPFALRVVRGITLMMGTFQRARKAGASFGFAIATALDGAAGGGTRFREGFVKVRAVFTRVMGAVRKALSVAIPALMKFGRGIVEGLKPAMPFLENVLLPLLKGVAIGVIGAIVGAWKVVWPVLQLLFRALGWIGTKAAPFRGVIEGIGKVVGFVFAGPILKGIGLLSKFGGVLGVVGRLAGAAGSFVLGFGRVVGAVVGAVVKFGVRLVSLWAGTWGRIGSVALLAGRLILTNVRNAIGKVLGFLKGVGSKFLGAGKGLWQSLVKGMKDAFGSGAGFVKDIAGRFLSFVVKQLNEAVPNKLGPINLPNNPISIPAFAGGGILRSGMGIVGEHRPEAISVLPGGGVRIDPLPQRLARRAAMVPDPFSGGTPAPTDGGGGSDDGGFDVHVYIDGEKVNTKLARVVKRKRARK